MSKFFTIFVTDDSIDEEEVGYHEVVQWSYENLEHPNVIPVTIEQIYELSSKGVLDIISELNDSMLGEGEDDWVIDSEVKMEILNRLNASYNYDLPVLGRLKELLRYSIEKNRNIYFHF